MAMNSQVCFLTIIFLLATVLSSAVGGRNQARFLTPSSSVGGWKPIENLKDPHVKEIAEFAVREHNKAVKTSLRLYSVVEGEEKVVAGVNYKLVLKAKEGAAVKKYEAIVWERAWLHIKNLTSFEPLKA